MCKQTTVPKCNTIVFVLGTLVGVLAGHADTNSLFTFKHLLVIFVASIVFYLTQITSNPKLDKLQ